MSEPGNIAVYSYVSEVGYTRAANQIQTGDAPLQVLRAVNRDKPFGGSPAAESELQTAAEHGIRLITPADAEWPHDRFGADLNRLATQRVKTWKLGEATPEIGEALPPLWLWVKGEGNLAPLVARSVSIVGARAATAYGEHVAGEMAFALVGKAIRGVQRRRLWHRRGQPPRCTRRWRADGAGRRWRAGPALPAGESQHLRADR